MPCMIGFGRFWWMVDFPPKNLIEGSARTRRLLKKCHTRHKKNSIFTEIHPLRPANCTLYCLEVLFLFRSLSTDPRTLLCKRRIEEFHRAQIVKFVSFTGAFTSKYVVKSVKEACETVHSTPKETCQHTKQFDRPCRTACFWWVKETPKDVQECDLGLCKFVGYFEGMGANQLCRIVVGISSQIGRDGHRDMGDVSTYGKMIRNLLDEISRFESLCRYSEMQVSQSISGSENGKRPA